MADYIKLPAAIRAAINACVNRASEQCLGPVDYAAVYAAADGSGYNVGFNGWSDERRDGREIYRTAANGWADLDRADLDAEIDLAIANARQREREKQ